MEQEKGQTMDIDELLPKIGEFGKYQKLILGLMCLPGCIACSMLTFSQIFMMDVPLHWCHEPELDFLSPEERRNLAIPLREDKNNTWNSCYRYAVNWTQILQTRTSENILLTSSFKTEKCSQGYEYDKSEVLSSIVMDFDLVCDYSLYPTIALAIWSCGSLVGVYIFGYLNDKYGRRFVFFLCLTIVMIGNIITTVAPNFSIWVLSRFISGLTVPAIYQIPFILGIELVGPKYRSIVNFAACLYYTFGLMALSGLAYLIDDWVHLTLATTLPFTLCYIYWFFLPESPRWLLSVGKYEEAISVLETIARVNKKTIPKSFNDILNEEIDSQKRLLKGSAKFKNSSKLMSLCRTPNMRLKTVLITFNWFVNITNYIGLNYFGPALGSNQYLSFFLSAVVELPSYLFMYFVMNKWGRRWVFSIAMIVGGVSAVATVLLPEDATTEFLILYLIAKAAISASTSLMYLYAGEIFPTELRGLGVGTASYVGGIGLIIIPFITYLGNENLVIPLIVMGTMSILGGLTSLRLPETLNQPLPQTLKEAEEFGINMKMGNICQCIPPATSRRGSLFDEYEDAYRPSISSKPPSQAKTFL